MKIKLFEEWGYLDKYYEEISYDDFDISDVLNTDYTMSVKISKSLRDINSHLICRIIPNGEAHVGIDFFLIDWNESILSLIRSDIWCLKVSESNYKDSHSDIYVFPMKDDYYLALWVCNVSKLKPQLYKCDQFEGLMKFIEDKMVKN